MELKKVVSLTSTVALLSALVLGTSSTEVSHAAKPLPNSPNKVINTYLNANQVGDVDLMVELADDVRFNDETAQKNEYTQRHKENPLVDYKIVDKDVVDATHVNFSVVLEYQDKVDLPVTPFETVNENGQWKVLIEPLEVNMNPKFPDYFKVKKSKTKSREVRAAVVEQNSLTQSVLYWDFNNIASNEEIISNNSFDQVRYDGQLTLNGWQESNYSGSPYVQYEVIKITDNVFSSYDKLSVSGTYPQSGGTWFTRYLTDVPFGVGYKMRFKNLTTSSSSGAGNAYE
ncbi:MAG TPA: hypothetical protein VFV52_03935 [Bacilli bacterium]|nr:hypothetical protein [Bacilli bacterium]